MKAYKTRYTTVTTDGEEKRQGRGGGDVGGSDPGVSYTNVHHISFNRVPLLCPALYLLFNHLTTTDI